MGQRDLGPGSWGSLEGEIFDSLAHTLGSQALWTDGIRWRG